MISLIRTQTFIFSYVGKYDGTPIPRDLYGLVNQGVFHRPVGYCDIRGSKVGALLTNHTLVEHEKRKFSV